MSKELIERIRAKKRNATDEEDDAADALEAQRRELIAAQAQNKVLRDALEQFTKAFDDGEDTSDYWVWNAHANRMKAALAQSTDDTSLRELLKAERERCAKVADEWQTAIHDPRYQCDCATAIRAMEDQ